MKQKSLPIILATIIPVLAFARLGDSIAQAQKRYGQGAPLKLEDVRKSALLSTTPDEVQTRRYETPSFFVFEQYLDGKCGRTCIRKKYGDDLLSWTETYGIFSENFPGFKPAPGAPDDTSILDHKDLSDKSGTRTAIACYLGEVPEAQGVAYVDTDGALWLESASFRNAKIKYAAGLVAKEL